MTFSASYLSQLPEPNWNIPLLVSPLAKETPKSKELSNQSEIKKSFDKDVRSTSQKTDAIFQKIPKKPSWLITGASQEFLYFITDIPNLYLKFRSTISNQFNPTANLTSQMISGISILTGYITGCRGYVQNKQARKIGDVWGQICGKAKIASGGLEMASGAIQLPMSGLSIAAITTSSKVVFQSLLVLGKVSSGLSAVSVLLSTTPHMVAIAKKMELHWNLKKTMNDPQFKTKNEKLAAGIRYIIDQFNLTESDRKNIILRVKNKKLTPINIDSKDNKILSQFDKDYIDRATDEIGQEYRYDHDRIGQLKAHIKNEFIIEKKRKKVEFERRTSKSCTELIIKELQKKDNKQLVNRLFNKKDFTAIDQAEIFLKKFQKAHHLHLLFNVSTCLIYLIGASLLLAGIGCSLTGGAIPIGLIVTGLVICILTCAHDSYSIYQAYKKHNLHSKDKAVIALSNLFLGSSIIFGIFFPGGSAASMLIGSTIIYTSYLLYSTWSEKTSINKPQEKPIFP